MCKTSDVVRDCNGCAPFFGLACWYSVYQESDMFILLTIGTILCIYLHLDSMATLLLYFERILIFFELVHSTIR
jgi:hypothetical protein